MTDGMRHLPCGQAVNSNVRGDVERNVDPEMKKFADDVAASYMSVLDHKIGELSVDLIKMYQSKDPSRAEENGLCDLVADAFRGIGDAQIGFINAGTVRSNLHKGDVTYRHIVDILPFCNTVVTAKVTGQMISGAAFFHPVQA